MGSLSESSVTPYVHLDADEEYVELFRQHRASVFRFAAMLCDDDLLAEEIVAEVFARVLLKWRNAVVVDALPYLRRAVLNEMRSRWRHRAHVRRAVDRALVDRGDNGDVDRVELREPLLSALVRLPLRQRTVVVLRYVEDLSEAQVAHALAMAPGTVKSHASRGLATLRMLIQEEQ